MTEAQNLDPIGLQGSPLETLNAMQTVLKGLDLKHATVTVISDWQDRRDSARYAVLVKSGPRVALSEDAFGPRYGAGGTKAMADLLEHLSAKGAINFKESVLAPHEFSRLLEYPDAHAILQLTANANPASPAIWSKVLDQ
jgi:Protein of unknown function (DUF3197)